MKTQNVLFPQSEDRYFFVWNKCGFIKITENDILYLEASRSYCNIHLCNDRTLLVSVPMSRVSEHLSEERFIRIHRTFIIHIHYIAGLTGNTLQLLSGEKLTIGREYRHSVFSRFTFIGSKNKKYECPVTDI